MIAYFPTLYPDELVYSWFCRYYVHSGYLSHKMALQKLYCKRSDNPSKEFIGNLRPEAIELLDKIYPLDKLVLNHTMYPQYARFIPLEQRKTALYRLGHETCDASVFFLEMRENNICGSVHCASERIERHMAKPTGTGNIKSET